MKKSAKWAQQFVPLTKYYYEQIKSERMGGASRINSGDEKRIQNICLEVRREETTEKT